MNIYADKIWLFLQTRTLSLQIISMNGGTSTGPSKIPISTAATPGMMTTHFSYRLWTVSGRLNVNARSMAFHRTHTHTHTQRHVRTYMAKFKTSNTITCSPYMQRSDRTQLAHLFRALQIPFSKFGPTTSILQFSEAFIFGSFLRFSVSEKHTNT
jgi:hypothetical protein